MSVLYTETYRIIRLADKHKPVVVFSGFKYHDLDQAKFQLDINPGHPWFIQRLSDEKIQVCGKWLTVDEYVDRWRTPESRQS